MQRVLILTLPTRKTGREGNPEKSLPTDFGYWQLRFAQDEGPAIPRGGGNSLAVLTMQT